MVETGFKWKLILILPCVIFLLAFGLFPAAYSIGISLTSMESGLETRIIGAANFLSLLSDTRFVTDMRNTLFLMTAGTLVEFLIGLGLALILTQRLKGVNFFRGLFLTPMMLPAVIIAYVYILLFDTNRGPINYIFGLLGVHPLDWRSNPTFAPLTIIIVDAWQWIPFMTIILLAGLESLPVETQEAALVDGASSWEVFRHIKLPLMMPVMTVALVLRAIDLFKLFDIVLLLTGGGPGGVTETANLYIYYLSRQFFRFGYASASAICMLIISSVLFTLFLLIRRRGEAT